MLTILTTLHSKFIHPSLALPCLAAYCGEACGDLRIREFTVHEPRETILAALLAENPDVIAFSVYIWNRRQTLDLVDALAVARPEIRIVLGGPEVSFEKTELFDRHRGLSALVRGEGELPLKNLLSAWAAEDNPKDLSRLTLRLEDGVTEGPDGPPLPDLDAIPSPFALELVDLSRGFVYLETSRGCPYRCAFCMSSLDEVVRSFSMARIKSDLMTIMERQVPKVKLVDRTFNYDPARAREIFDFILKHNRGSHFHFEIGAHLLDEATLELLQRVPSGMFQFEIGVQSTLPGTLDRIGRSVSLEKLESRVRRLRAMGNIHLHLDLIAGLPGENRADLLASIDRVALLSPHHLQLEPVKLLPGSPLRQDATRLGIRFDPNPPYTVLATGNLSFSQLERLRTISRLLDLTWNSGHFKSFLDELERVCGGLAAGLDRLAGYCQERELLRHPLSQRGIFEMVWRFAKECFSGGEGETLGELLACDYARCERVPKNNAPPFFDTGLSSGQLRAIKQKVREAQEEIRGQGVKLQHFAARFCHLPGAAKETVILFLYLTRSGSGMQVRELRL